MNYWTSAASNVSATLYPSWTMTVGYGDDANGAAGVREPRRPILPVNTGGAALDLPTAEISPSAELTA